MKAALAIWSGLHLFGGKVPFKPHPDRGLTMKIIAILLTILGLTAPALAEKAAVNQTFFGNVAISGTDPVAYFTEGKAVEGRSEFSHEWDGANWHFKSAENRDAFAKSPETYAPQFGGYCAWAVSQGYTATIDPAAWSIVDEKLYLNYSKDVRA